jgi:acetolactate synthase-1/2/3 large subunit
VTDAAEIPAVFAKAFEIARSGKPGPVLVDVTKDAQAGMMKYLAPKFNPKARWLRKALINDSEVKRAAQIINDAKQPILIVGHGVMISGAENEIMALAEKTNMPVVSTLLGLSAFPVAHPLYNGMLGMHGNYAANILCNQADVVIAVGMRFDDRVTGNLSNYLNDAKIIHIEVDQAEIDKNVRAEVGILADAKEALQALLPYISEETYPVWHKTFAEHHQKEVDTVILNETKPTSGQIKMAEAVALLSDKTNGEAIIVTDVGQHQMISARYYEFKKTNSHLTSGGLGTMGFALPAAIGAKMGAPDREVIAIAGDGGFQMNIQELAVLKQEGVALKMVILNNGYLGMVRQWQELFFEKRYSFTKMLSPDFVAVAKGYGLDGRSVSTRQELSGAFDEMLASKEAFLLEIKVEQQENVFPMVPSGMSISDTKLSCGEA